MPLICDVCGKTPDVEVRKYQGFLSITNGIWWHCAASLFSGSINSEGN